MKLLDIINLQPDKNQKWLLISLFISGLLGTYISPCLTKSIITVLPAEWIAFESLFGSIAGLVISMIWRGNIRATAIRYFAIFCIAESIFGCLLGMYMCFYGFNALGFAICSLLYTSFISRFVAKCAMAFKATLWQDTAREFYDNNEMIVGGIVCIIGFTTALFLMPSLKVSLFLWGICCIADDIGWIIVYLKNQNSLLQI